MKEILIVPDVHGRDFWIEPCNKWHGDIIFLGDYHDPYPWQVSKEDSLKNLSKLVNFYLVNKDRCTCLIGNHCLSYLNTKAYKCRFDLDNWEKVKTYIEMLQPKIAFTYGKYLFSHAGITEEWLYNNGLTTSDVESMDINNPILNQVSSYRGGDDYYSSPLWCDIVEFDSCDKPKGYYQIFGHTQSEAPAITDTWAMLDCRQCFVLNLETNEISKFDGNL